MNNTITTLASTIAIAAFSHAASAADFAADLNKPDNPQLATLHADEATVAGMNHDFKMMVGLAAKAYREDPTVQNEFNLATAYHMTGQIILAIPLYADVSTRGKYTWSKAVYDYRDTPRPAGSPRVIDSTLGAESIRRLNMIAGAPAPFEP